MKKWIDETKIVYTEKDLKDAIKARYSKIQINGEYADSVYKKMNRDPKLDLLSDVAIIGGFFAWPLLVAGVAGKAFILDFSKYTMTSITNKEVVIELSKKYKK